MSEHTTTAQGQESLFLMAPSGAIAFHESEPEIAVPLMNRAILLGEALDYLMRASMLEGYSKSSDVAQKLGEHAEKSQRGAQKNAAELIALAKIPFFKAYGLDKMLHCPDNPQSMQRTTIEAENSFGNFKLRVSHLPSKDMITPDEFRKRLAKTIETQRGIVSIPPVTEIEPDYQQAELVMPLPNNQSSGETEASDDIWGLSTREKLIILSSADDTGFLPTTNREKNMAMAYLDYIKSDDYDRGAQSQLIEVGNFHGKHHTFAKAKEHAEQAARSIAFEFADWYQQSNDQLNDLETVKELLKEVYNPDLSLAYALHVDMQKAVPLIRFLDLVELRRSGTVSVEFDTGGVRQPKFDVLRTQNDRTKSDAQIGRTKVTEDPYTAANRTKTVTKWLQERMKTIRVGDVRNIIDEAIVDQMNRRDFHRLVLVDLAEGPTNSTLLKEAQVIAKQALAIPTSV